MNALQRARSALGRLRRRLRPVKVTIGEPPNVRILHGVKLYREVHFGGLVFRGTADTPGRTIGYVFDFLGDDAVAGKSLLDLGSAGGAVCFEAIRRGAQRAVGLEMEDRRIRGARYIQRRMRVASVRFEQQDFWEFFQRTRPAFDVIVILNVLHHLANPMPLLRRIAKGARAHVVVEIPIEIDVARYSEYSRDLAALPPEKALTGPDDVTQFLARYDFVLERQQPSPPETKFCGHDEVERGLYVYRRLAADRVKTFDERAAEVEPFRAGRDASWQTARRDAANLDCAPGERLDDILTKALGATWTNRDVNVLLCGPAACGKSHLFETLQPSAQPPYHYKVFKSPDAGNKDGLRQHLDPPHGAGGRVGQVLVNTVDDLSSHCSIDELASRTAGKPVVTLLLNVDFDEHLHRLYRRQVDRVGTRDAAVDYEVPLQYDCAVVAERLRRHGCDYRVLTMIR